MSGGRPGRVATALLAALVLVGCGSDRAASPSTTSNPPEEFEPPTAAEVADSIVRIVGFGCGAPALGSGFAVDTNLIVTSGHIVTGRDPETLAVVTPGGVEASARLVAFDPDFDLAVLRVDDVDFEPVTLRTDVPADVGVGMAVRSENEIEPIEFTVDNTVIVNWDGVFRDTESTFHGLRLLADINRGDSGSGLFVSADDVIGLIHSTNRNGLERGYAVSGRQISEYLETIDPDTEIVSERCA